MPEEGVLPGERMAEYDEIRKRTGGSIDGAELARLQNAIEPWDIDFRTVGEFYHKIESAFARIPEERLFIGNPAMQANPAYLDLPKELVRVVDAASARQAIEMIVEQVNRRRPNIPMRTSRCSIRFDESTKRLSIAPTKKAGASNRFAQC